MYADPNNFVETNSGSASFTYNSGLSATAKYYFGTSYTLDKNGRGYKVSGDLLQGTITSDKVGYYTCFSTNKDVTCQSVNSTMKNYLDNWYKNNLNSYTDKISKDTIFCNNRNISNKTNGTYNNAGHGLNPTMYGYERYYNHANQGKLGPTLSCQLNDSFNVEGTNGNEKLTYPVGLITMDEVNMAGGINGSANMLYYLYSGSTYWTMSPADFSDWFFAIEAIVTSSGELGRNDAWYGYGVRPVINIDPDKITFTGNGTMQDPYVIS